MCSLKLCASLVPSSKAVICGFGTRLCVHMRTKFEMAFCAMGSSWGVLEEFGFGLVVEVMQTLSVCGPVIRGSFVLKPR